MAATTLPYNPRYCFAPVEDTEVGVQQTRIFVEGTRSRTCGSGASPTGCGSPVTQKSAWFMAHRIRET